MAHPCYACGSECYCSGSWDDVIVDNTPSSCEGCGCILSEEDVDDWDYDEEDDWYDEEEDYDQETKDHLEALQKSNSTNT